MYLGGDGCRDTVEVGWWVCKWKVVPTVVGGDMFKVVGKDSGDERGISIWPGIKKYTW